MTQKEKKRKAAAIAVSAYILLLRTKKEDIKQRGWNKVSMALRLQQQGLLRFNGRIPSSYRLKI